MCSISISNIIWSIWDARKASTVEKYCQAVRKFLSFCKSNNFLITLPLDSLHVANYLSYISESSKTMNAVSNVFAALKWLHSFVPGLNAGNDPLNDTFLSRIAEGQKRNLAKMKSRKKPLTNNLIGQILNIYLKKTNPSLIQMRNTLIPCLAYSLLLRHDELSHINCAHISETIHGFEFYIPSSKTDIYRKGKTVFLSSENTDICRLLQNYLSKANLKIGDNHFLFSPIECDKFSKKDVVKNTKLSYQSYRGIIKNSAKELGLNPDDFGTHSCRAGGATDLAPQISQFELLLSGRWTDSRSIGSYVETPNERRYEINSYLNLNL